MQQRRSLLTLGELCKAICLGQAQHGSWNLQMSQHRYCDLPPISRDMHLCTISSENHCQGAGKTPEGLLEARSFCEMRMRQDDRLLLI